jgi:hypothetical protein
LDWGVLGEETPRTKPIFKLSAARKYARHMEA